MKDWKIDKIEELSEEEQKDYLEKLKKKYNDRVAKRKKIWEAIFAAGAIGILSGCFMIGLGGEALDTAGAITILSSTVAEFGITFGSAADVAGILMEAEDQIKEVEKKISKKR